MKRQNLINLPSMLYADKAGRIYDHPYFRMAGMWGYDPAALEEKDLILLPEFSKLFYIPGCPPVGMDPETGKYKIVSEVDIDGVVTECYAVAAFLEPGVVRSHLPAAHYRSKTYVLPMWAYTAVGFRDENYWAAGFRIEYNHRWDPSNYDDRELVPAIKDYKKKHGTGPLVSHLANCATQNHCFAAKNLFLKRWEAPLPISQGCNAACLGCLSLQPDRSCEASHQRITFRPSKKDIVSLAVEHLDHTQDAIISFGQGCEGEPLTEYRLIADSIKEIRSQTDSGTINLNTNGSWPERVRLIIDSGLDSIRISLNSARPEFYSAYYRPKNYDFNKVVESIALSRKMGVYTMINYLVFPGITDQEAEISALIELIQETGTNFLHFKNLCVDPSFYLEKMPEATSRGIGIKQMISILYEEFPDLKLGYFNQAVR
ncbi:MAG: radical SAM protein [Deltaproteobacteria bacterium]|nr:radical SAM protein [Deltaproteobacteria bacterium]